MMESASWNRTPTVADLLVHPDPALSLYDNLRPNLKYLMTDSWRGLGGQFTTALPLLFLASMTSRIAIVPSFNDEHHYGADFIVNMSMLYDLERFRQITGILFVEQDDVKVRDPKHPLTQEDDVGCYISNWSFDQGLSYGHHNIHQMIIRLDRPGVAGKDREILAKEGITGDKLPRNLKTATKTSSLMCYTKLWDFKRAGQDEISKQQKKLMASQWNEFNRHPEWHYVGRYLDFAPKSWDIVLASVRASLGVTTIPQELITMHIRRGDFLTLCEKGTDCTPSLDAFVAALKDLKAELKMLSPELDVDKIQVLITTDEQDDRAILDQIAANGWIVSQTPPSMIEEAFGDAWKLTDSAIAQTPPSMIEEAFGDAWKLTDSAIAQAILSLGTRGFVGTSNSQVSQLTQLRIQSYYKRKHAPTRMVDRSGKFMRKRSLAYNGGFSKKRLAIR